MSQVIGFRQMSFRVLGPCAALVAMSAFLGGLQAQETPSEELNRQLDQAADQSTQQQDTLNDQLDQAEGQANEAEAEITDQLEQSSEQLETQEAQLDQQLNQAEDSAGAAPRAGEGTSLPSPELPAPDGRSLRLGIAIDESAELSDGITVGEIMTGSAAAAAGLRRGDYIVSIDGHAVTTADELDRWILGRAVGDSVEVIVLREGQRYPLTVTFDETHYHLPADHAHRVDYPPADTRDYEDYHSHAGPHGWLGVMLQPSNPPYRARGAGVVSVVQGGPAFAVGIEAGDRIIEFNHEPLDSSEHLLHLLSHTDAGDQVELLVHSDGYDRIVTTDLVDAHVFYHHPHDMDWYHAGFHSPWHHAEYHSPWHAHYPANVEVQSSSHEELVEQQQRLVEQQHRIELMLQKIQADIASIQSEINIRATSGTVD